MSGAVILPFPLPLPLSWEVEGIGSSSLSSVLLSWTFLLFCFANIFFSFSIQNSENGAKLRKEYHQLIQEGLAWTTTPS